MLQMKVSEVELTQAKDAIRDAIESALIKALIKLPQSNIQILDQ